MATTPMILICKIAEHEWWECRDPRHSRISVHVQRELGSTMPEGIAPDCPWCRSLDSPQVFPDLAEMAGELDAVHDTLVELREELGKLKDQALDTSDIDIDTNFDENEAISDLDALAEALKEGTDTLTSLRDKLTNISEDVELDTRPFTRAVEAAASDLDLRLHDTAQIISRLADRVNLSLSTRAV